MFNASLSFIFRRDPDALFKNRSIEFTVQKRSVGDREFQLRRRNFNLET
jgi:hypothetical protein